MTTRNQQILAGAIGNTLEYYDFAVFAYLAPVIGRLFFPSSDAIASITQAYGVFAAGYLMRPLGGIVFGHFGDRYGWKRALWISIGVMALPSVLVGCLPTYNQVGVTASLLLLGLRLLQGLSVGGEGITSYAFLGEMAENKRRGFLASFGESSAAIGYLMDTVVGFVTSMWTRMHPDRCRWSPGLNHAKASRKFGVDLKSGPLSDRVSCNLDRLAKDYFRETSRQTYTWNVGG